jgi:dihydrofolate reductase
MRKIIESSFVSLDGVVGDPRTWAMEYFDAAAQQGALEQLLASDGMLMGRRTYEYFVDVMPNQEGAYADRMNEMPKYVFSSTLEQPRWQNTTVIRGEVVREVTQLKQQDGRDLVIYGHGQLGHTLLEHGLLDEVHLGVHPVRVGRGQLFFREGSTVRLEPIATTPLATGVVVLSYRPVGCE